jgi:hypothetical protein
VSIASPDNFFLADGGETCDEACGRFSDTCDLAKLTDAASSVTRCKEILTNLGKSYGKAGTYKDDQSGCTYHGGQTGWVQVMNPGRDEGAAAAPQCDVRNRDSGRMRVCACVGGAMPGDAIMGSRGRLPHDENTKTNRITYSNTCEAL